MRHVILLVALVLLALAAPAALAHGTKDRRAASLNPGLTDDGYSVRFFWCQYDTWPDGTITESCQSVKWCKGTVLKPRECVRVAPWTHGSRTT